MRYIRLMTYQFVTAFAVLVNQASPTTPASTTSTAATASNSVDKLTGVTGPLVLWSMVGLIAVAGIIILVGRGGLNRGYLLKQPGARSGRGRSSAQPAQASAGQGPPANATAANESGKSSSGTGDDPDTSIVRSWLAITLVGGLLVLGAASFGLADETLRSTVVGGVVSASSAAVAFYFAGKAASEARKDLVNAQNVALVAVPDLKGLTIDAARGKASGQGLFLAFDPGVQFSGTDAVASTSPPAGTQVQSGAYIVVRK